MSRLLPNHHGFQPAVGLYIPPMVWAAQYGHSADTVLMVLASEHYDSSDYLRDYDEFLELSACSGIARDLPATR